MALFVRGADAAVGRWVMRRVPGASGCFPISVLSSGNLRCEFLPDLLRLCCSGLSRLVRFASWFACGASNSSLSGGRSAGTGTGLMVKRSCGLDAASWYAWHDSSRAEQEPVMGDPMVPERPGGRHAAAQEQTGIPAMPVISPSEQVLGGAYPLLDGISPTIGWEFRSEAKGGHRGRTERDDHADLDHDG
jgi:hypothetical protein